ncbi:MAG: hypothetical protein EXS08_15375 [Planctomycetes bacterium]|nr:hypothetical protein [Planctomycetota bacterium]
MNVFALQLWREWREHRFALLSLALVLPFATWLVALPVSRTLVNDPLFHSSAALGFAVVLLIAVGGELLGAERRGVGLRWLERMPAGLSSAFTAKLVFFLLTTITATVLGYGSGWLVGFLRPSVFVSTRAVPDLSFLVRTSVVLGLWTFAASTWALRGGLSLLAAALILGVVGYPLWLVKDAGYQPRPGELTLLIALLAPAALLGAWSGFVRGARHGHGTVRSALYGLAPVVPVLLITASWSAVRLDEREVFDPLRKDFALVGQMITGDGHYAIGQGLCFLEHWDPEKLPEYALRIDLRTGAAETLGRYVALRMRNVEGAHGLPRLDEFVVEVEGRDEPLVFAASDGAPRVWDPRKLENGWYSLGLGAYLEQTGKSAVIRDPFRERDYPVAELGPQLRHQLWVRPGRWLCETNDSTWCWFDPDTKTESATGWAPDAQPLVLLQDGRLLLADPRRGLLVLEPERGLSRALDSQGIEASDIEANWSGLRTPKSSRDLEADMNGPIVLRTKEHGWLVIDPELTRARRLELPRLIELRRRVGVDTFIVRDVNSGALSRLNVATGALTRLWPPAN